MNKTTFEVRVVRNRQGRERKHRVLSCMVTARSALEAVALAGVWVRFDAVLRVTAVTPVMIKGQVDSLTDDELELARCEGYGAVWVGRDAKRQAKAERAAKANMPRWKAEEIERLKAEDAELAGLVVA